MPKKIILDEEKLLREYWENNTFDEIARLNNVSKDVINRYFREFKNKGIKLSRGKIQPRRYPMKEDFFEQIDSEEKAYILGLICADGNLKKDKNVIDINCKRTDFAILEKVSKIIYLDNRNHLYNSEYFDERTQKTYYRTDIVFTSKKMYNDLLNLGLAPQKSLTLEYPKIENINNDLKRHFIRGYFDGDGGINFNIRENKNVPNLKDWRIKIVGTFKFLMDMNKEIKNQTELSFGCGEDRNIFASFLGGNVQVKQFCDWLYKDATIYLERKYNRYLELINQ